MINFKDDLKSGQEREKDFAEYLKSIGYTNVRFNESDDRSQLKKYDLMAIHPDGYEETFEIKWDSYVKKTGNIYVEIRQGYGFHTPSGISVCEADWFIYIVNGMHTYMVSPKDLKQHMRNNHPEFRIVSQKRDAKSYSQGVLVPQSSIEQYKINYTTNI